jgi:predicted RNA polymerase sigma factor
MGILGDFDLAEDAAQEAFAIAAERWPRDGMPEAPVAWLVRAGRNRAIDRVRREQTLRTKTRLLQVDQRTVFLDDVDLDDNAAHKDQFQAFVGAGHDGSGTSIP